MLFPTVFYRVLQFPSVFSSIVLKSFLLLLNITEGSGHSGPLHSYSTNLEPFFWDKCQEFLLQCDLVFHLQLQTSSSEVHFITEFNKKSLIAESSAPCSAPGNSGSSGRELQEQLG